MGQLSPLAANPHSLRFFKLEELANVLNCQMGFWPIKYLGAHVSGGRLREKDLEFVEEKQDFFRWLARGIQISTRKESFD
jgi:hypothetical protein